MHLSYLPLKFICLLIETLIQHAQLPMYLAHLSLPGIPPEHPLQVLHRKGIVLVFETIDLNLRLELPFLQVNLGGLRV